MQRDDFQAFRRITFSLAGVVLLVLGLAVLSCVIVPTPVPTPTPIPTPIPTSAPVTLTTSVNPYGAGSVTPGSGTFDEGTPVTLTASPASGYTFSYWGGDASGSSPSTTVTMSQGKNVIAYFRAMPTPTPTPTPAPAISLTFPADGSQVSWRDFVRGTSKGVFGDATLSIYVLIYPLGEPKGQLNGPWWIQPPVTLRSDGTWEAYCYFGRDPALFPADQGDYFRVIAIVTRQGFQEGQQWYSLPQYVAASNMVEVRRR